MHVLAIDLGTSGVKVGVFDPDAALVGSSEAPLTTRLTPDGGAEQDATEWWDAIGSCARAAMAAAAASGIRPEPLAVAVTAQYLSTLAIDRHGRPRSPVLLWMDHRGAPYHPVLEDGDAFFLWLDRHGFPPLSNDGLAHIALLRHQDPALGRDDVVFVEPVDAVVSRLVGRPAATQNSAFGLMAIDNRVHGSTSYDAELLARAGLDEAVLPPLHPMDEPLGTVTAEAAEHLGVPPGTVVLPGTLDSITSAVGTGAVGPDALSLVIGTTSVLVSHVPDRRTDLDHAITTVPSPVAGQYFVLAENGVGGRALEFVLRNVIYAEDALSVGGFPADAWERAERVASSAPAGANGALFLPWLVGSMSPQPDDEIRAGFANLGLSTSRGDLMRAVYEGVAANAAWLFPPVGAMTGHQHRRIRFGGGGARSSLWGELVADAFGVEVERLADPEHTNARGAALLAQVQLGRRRWDEVPAALPVAQRHEPHADRAGLYRSLVEHLAAYHELTRPFHRGLERHP